MVKLRAQFSKGPEARFISHLDLMRSFERALRRTGLPVAYSEGFNPHPKIAFASAMPLGATSDAEYVDVVMTDEVSPERFRDALNRQLPLGLRIVEARVVALHGQALMAGIDTTIWQATFPAPAGGRETVAAAVERLLGQGVYMTVHQGKHGERAIDILPLIDRLDVAPCADWPPCTAGGQVPAGCVRVVMMLATGTRGAVRPEEVVAALADLGGFDVERGDIELHRVSLTKGAVSPWDL
ncbi:MAG: TIGR03936 family radical SAM-associated protein [Chloroflexota bacterium]